TRQPVLLDQWVTELAPTRPFTTVMNWSSYGVIESEGVIYGQKDVEFRKFIDLPRRVAPLRLEIAMNTAGINGPAPVDLLWRHSWTILSPETVAGDLDHY